MNPIQAAEDVLADWPVHTPEEQEKAFEALLTHARTLEAELARLREPLGDHKELVDRLNGIYRIPITDGYGPVGSGDEPDNPNEFVRRFETPPISKEAATYIERQAAELARKTAVVDAYWEIVESFRKENAELEARLASLTSVSEEDVKRAALAFMAARMKCGSEEAAAYWATWAPEDKARAFDNLRAALTAFVSR